MSDKGRQSSRELPLEGATDTTGCWNRGVQNSTRARKFRVDAVHAGRSMIEMLGVLATVGVLTVGGIAGYSKAMWAYKTNKQAEQVSGIINAMLSNKEQFNKNNESNKDAVPILRAMGEVPDEMIIANDDDLRPFFSDEEIENNREELKNSYIRDALGVMYWVKFGYKDSYMYAYISASEDSVNICKNLYALGKKFSPDIIQMEIPSIKHGWAYGDISCPPDFVVYSNTRCLKDLTLNDADNFCHQNCDGYNTCSVKFYLSRSD